MHTQSGSMTVRESFFSRRSSTSRQCCGCVGSICIWASRILHYFVRIRIRILPSASDKSKKSLDFYYFWIFWRFICENLCKCTFKKVIRKKNYFFLAFFQPLINKAGSVSLDPRIRIQNIMSRIHNTASTHLGRLQERWVGSRFTTFFLLKLCF